MSTYGEKYARKMLARQSKERPGIRKSYMDEVLRKGTAVHDKHRAVTWDSVEYASPRLPPPALYYFPFMSSLMIFVCLKGSSTKGMFHDGFVKDTTSGTSLFVRFSFSTLSSLSSQIVRTCISSQCVQIFFLSA